MQVIESQPFGIQPVAQHNTAIHLAHAKQHRKDLPVAITARQRACHHADSYTYALRPARIQDGSDHAGECGFPVNPSGDINLLPNLSVNLLDPVCQVGGMVAKMIIDATMRIAPDIQGGHGQRLDMPQGTDVWRQKLAAVVGEIAK